MMQATLAGRVVVVTGTSRGIGAAVARELSSHGATVAGLSLEGTGAFDTCACDVRSAASVDEAFTTLWSRHGRIDALVNNAGIYPTTGWDRMTEAEWDDVLDTNLKGAFLCTRAAARGMVQAKSRGAIVNVSSTASLVARPGTAHYAASKAGLNAMTRVLALELAPFDIRVNAVVAGLIATEGARRHEATAGGAAELRAKLARVPLRTQGSPEDVATLVAYLVSDASRYVTGSLMVVDGGYSLGIPAYASADDAATEN